MAFVFVCIYLFFLLIRPQEWAILELAPFRPVLITQTLAIIVTSLELLLGKIKMPTLGQPWWIIMTGLFLAVSFSNVANFLFDDAYEAFIDFGKIYLTFILIWISLDSVKRIELFSILLVALSTFIAVHCILLHETGQGFGWAEGLQRSVTNQQNVVTQAAFYGIFGDPNDVSQLFVTALPFCVYLIIRFKNFILRCVYCLTVAIQVLGVYSTESRGGYIAMATTFFVVLRFIFPLRWFIILSIIGALTIVAFLPARLSGGVIDASSSNRVDFWGQATEAFRSNPVFGVGYGNAKDYISKNKAVHNSFVQAYAEIGVVGYTFWFIAFAFSCFSMWRLSNALADDKEEASLILWMKCIVPGIVGYSVAGFFLSRAYVLPNYVIMAMTAACFSITGNKISLQAIKHYCYIGQNHWFIWIGISLISMLVIYFGIIILNTVK